MGAGSGSQRIGVALPRMSELIGRVLVWRRPELVAGLYELRDGATLVARLTRNDWSDAARAECVDGVWTIRRHGTLRTSVTVQASADADEREVFGGDILGSVCALRTPDGDALSFVARPEVNSYGVVDSSGRPVAHYRFTRPDVSDGTLELDPAARELPELGLVAMVGWYLALHVRRDSGSPHSA